jgi:DNA-binding response OmpR family regulator
MGWFGLFKEKKNWRILIVEDDLPLRKFIADRLYSFGIDVIETGDGSVVIDLIKEHKPDCVVLDVMLPGKSGMQILEELRSTDKTTPVVVLTTLSGEGGLKVQAAKHNAVFLNKANTALEVVINTILHHLDENKKND